MIDYLDLTTMGEFFWKRGQVVGKEDEGKEKVGKGKEKKREKENSKFLEDRGYYFRE